MQELRSNKYFKRRGAKAQGKNVSFSNYRTKNVLTISTLIIITVMFISTAFNANAQQTWDLSRCIDHALDNNIELHYKANLIKSQQVNVLESKANLLPDLNMGSGANMNFGRNIDGNTNTITFDQTLGNHYWISSSVDIFKGLVVRNTIGYNNYLLLATKEEALLARNKLIFNVLTSYYTAIYCIGLKNVAVSQVALSEMQFERMQKLVDVGRESPITVQELKSQWAGDKLSLTGAQSNMSKTLLELKQLLRLDANQSFEIDTSSVVLPVVAHMPNVDSLFSTAVNILPEIKQQEYLLDASAKDLAVAKGGGLPKIYLSAGFNTNYFDGDDLAYANQIENNQNQWINMGISIPIFNNAYVYGQIKRKQIALKNMELALETQREDLYTEIWNAMDELQSAENEYRASVELRAFSELTLRNITKKMEKGLAGTTDFEAAKQRFVSAEAALLKSKLIYIMRKQMLEFYQTGNWGHLGRER